MDRDELMKKLAEWHDNDEYQKIIDEISSIPEAERDYELTNQLGRAYNNIGRYFDAVEIFMTIKQQGVLDSLWHFRLGYAYYWLSMYGDALKEFEESFRLNPDELDAKRYIKSCKSIMSEANNRKDGRKYSKDIFIP